MITIGKVNNNASEEPETPSVASGKTTRLVDKYIQELFKDKWVDLIDHNDSNHNNNLLAQRVCQRMYLEHQVMLESDRTKFRIKRKRE